MLNNYILFLHWQLPVATYVLSCLCIPVSNAVVEWVFSHVTSVFKMKKVVILNVFKAGMNVVSFCLFFELCSSCFHQPSSNSAIRAPRVSPESSTTIYIGERELACFACLFHYPQSHIFKLLTRDLFFGPCHCSYIVVPCLAFRVHVAGVEFISAPQHGTSCDSAVGFTTRRMKLEDDND